MPNETERYRALRDRGYDIKFVSHAEAILQHDFPSALGEIEEVLADLTLPITEIIGSGGGETKFTQRLRNELTRKGWPKHIFEVGRTIDGKVRESISHEVDHVKSFGDAGTVALEMEWNNKDPFFDRDLENYKRLHADGAISVGVLITRGASLQGSLWDLVHRYTQEQNIQSYDDLVGRGYEPTAKQKKAVLSQVTRTRKPLVFADAWTSNFVGNKFGAATTHWEKRMHRVSRGVGNPCPLLLIGLPASIVNFDAERIAMVDETEADAPSGGAGGES
jgi:hypothetical protein